jgi:acyl-CoA thioester hydrolase
VLTARAALLPPRTAVPRMGEPFVHRLRVRYAECDPQGVLFNANYLAYVDHTITELWRAAYGGYQQMLDRGVDIVVAEAQLRFLGSARFDEELAIEAVVTHMGTTSLTTTYRFLRRDDVLLHASIRHVFIDRRTGIKTRIPEWARAGLAPWSALQPDAAPASPSG